jgi:hypothetical protein
VTSSLDVSRPTAIRPPRAGCIVVLIALSALGALAMLAALALIPSVGRPPFPADAAARGEALEQAVIAAVTKVRDPAGETWAIAIEAADINAWLATRLPKWIAHDPELADFAGATAVRIASSDGALFVEAPVGPAALGLVGTVRMPMELEDAPGARLLLDVGAARIGLLPVPLAAEGWASAGALTEELARFERRYPDRRIRLADGRFVEVRAISCEDGWIKIRFATLPAAASGR